MALTVTIWAKEISVIPVPPTPKSAQVIFRKGIGRQNKIYEYHGKFPCRLKQGAGSNLTCDLGPTIRIVFEAEMSALLCPYLGSRPAVDVDRQRGDGNVGSFRHDIEHDAISTDAITVSRAPFCARWKNSTCWCREHDRRPCWLTSGRAQWLAWSRAYEWLGAASGAELSALPRLAWTRAYEWLGAASGAELSVLPSLAWSRAYGWLGAASGAEWVWMLRECSSALQTWVCET